MAVGIVGGASKVHPTAKANLAILGVDSANELASIICAAGLAQNLGALRAFGNQWNTGWPYEITLKEYGRQCWSGW